MGMQRENKLIRETASDEREPLRERELSVDDRGVDSAQTIMTDPDIEEAFGQEAIETLLILVKRRQVDDLLESEKD